MLKVLIIAFVVLTFIYPTNASLSYVIFLMLFEGYIFLLNKIDKPILRNPDELSLSERAALKKYHLYFKYPFAASSFSSTLSSVQLATIVLVPWLLYKQIWIQAGMILSNYIFAAYLAQRLNPIFFLHNAVEKRGNEFLREEMMAVDSICNRIKSVEFDDE